MKKLTWLLVLLILFVTVGLSAETIKTGSNREILKINNADYIEISGEASVDEVEIQTVTTDNGEFIKISSAGTEYTTLKIGEAQLPVINKLIEIPFGAEPQIEIVSYKEKTVDLKPLGYDEYIYPAQPSYTKSTNPEDIQFFFNKDYYNSNSFEKTETASIEIKGVMRDTRIAFMQISPFSYNPGKGLLKIKYDIQWRVNLPGADQILTEKTKEKYHSPFFDAPLKGITLYKSRTPHDDHPTLDEYPFHYVIISYPDFMSAMEPLADWKREKGFKVTLVSTNTTGTTTSSIESYIDNLYNGSYPPDFILLVGDKDQIPAVIGTASKGQYNTKGSKSQSTDLYYGCVGTSDHIPDIYYGRFSANSLSELQPQIDKTLWYEKTQFTSGYDLSYLSKIVLTAGVDGTWAPKAGNGTIRYGTQEYFNSSNGITVDRQYLYEPTSAEESQGILNSNESSASGNIISDMNEGRAFYNYTAHGSQTSFADPSYTVTDVHNMTNTNEYPLVIGNCCVTGSFQISECFGESWLRKDNGGAIGYIGASNNSLWDEDYWWGVGAKGSANGTPPAYSSSALGAYDGVFHSHGESQDKWYVTNDAVKFCGNLAVLQGGSSNEQYYWEIYHTFGDPSIITYMGVPQDLSPSYGSLNVGSSSFTVDVGHSHALCAIYKDGVLYGSAMSGGSGEAVIALNPAITEPGTYKLTITAQFKKPYFADIQAAVPALVTISPTSIPVNTASSVTVTVKDESNQPIQGVIVWAEGLDYTSSTVSTNSSGQAFLSVNYPFGSSVNILGKEPGESYNLFEEELPVTGASNIANADVSVTTDYGLTGQLGKGLPGLLTAQGSVSGLNLMTSVDGGAIVNHGSSSAAVTPSSNADVIAYVTKAGYNVYSENITVIDAEGNMSGTVTDGSSPIQGADVEIYDSAKGLLYTAVSGSDGSYSIGEAFACGNYTIKVNKFGFNPYEDSFMLSYGSHTENVVMSAAAASTVSGTVSCEGTGISGASVKVYRKDTDELVTETTTNGSGYYSVNVTNFTYIFKVLAEGYSSVQQEAAVTGNMTLNFTTEVFNGFTSDFESDNGGLISNNTEGWQWGTDAEAGSHSGSKVWGTVLGSDYPAAVSDFTLDLPEFSIGSSWVVSWYQWREFEGSKSPKGDGGKTPFDGGNVKISTDGGTTFTLLSDFFTDTNYPDYVTEETYGGTISTGYSNPIGGEQAFTSTTGGEWKRASFDLSAFAGESVIIRLQFGADQSVTRRGWYIDDIFLGPFTTVQPEEPEIDVSPTTFDFGSVDIEAEPVETTITVTNTGNASLSISGITAPAGYQIKRSSETVWGSSISGFTVGQSSSESINARFTPASAGIYSGNIVISSNDSDEGTVNVSVTGTGTDVQVPEINITPSSLSFGDVETGTESTVKSFTIQNTGSGVLTVTSINAPSGFQIQLDSKEQVLRKRNIIKDVKWGSSISQFTISASSAKTVNVKFIPSSVQNYSGSITVASDDSDEGTLNVTVSGNGTAVPAPDINVTPTTINFGSVTAGETSSVSEILITNSGNASLTVSGITAPTGFEIQYAEKTKWSSSLGGFTLSASSSKTVEVRFTPSAIQSYSGTIAISSDDQDESQVNVSVSGSGTSVPEPEIAVTPLSLDFGNVQTGTTSITKSFVIDNIGTGDLSVSSITAPSKYEVKRGTSSVWSTSISSFTLSASGSETINVRFSPDAAETFSGNIVVSSDDSNEATVNVSVTGNGISDSDPFGDPVIYPNNPMTVYALVEINGSPAESGDIVAAFAGEELRGKQEVAIEKTAYVTLSVQVNTNGETIQFKIFDSSEGTIVNASETASAEIGGTLGSYPDNLFNITEGNAVQSINLTSGWNLISFCLTLEDMSPSAVFADAADKLVEVKSLDEVYNPAMPDFMNTLTSIEAGLGYWVNVSGAASLNLNGTPVSVSSTNITLNAGWNLAGYPGQNSITPAEAFAGITSDLVQVKSLSEVYDPSMPDYMNTLSLIEPDKGYWINVTSGCVLTYPESKSSAAETERINTGKKPVIYTNSMTVYAEIHKESVNQGCLEAYVNGELRGIAPIIKHKDSFFSTLVINTEKKDEKVSVMISENGKIYETQTVLQTVPGTAVGKEKYLDIQVNNKNNTPQIPEKLSMKISPNPFNPKTAVEFTLPEAGYVNASIYNIQGQLVETIVSERLNSGSHTVSWNAEKMVSGVYFCVIKTRNNHIIEKMILLK